MTDTKENPKRSGLVALVGRSNVGKSTLLNALVGTKVAITTPKPQTTRHAIQGVINDPRGQAVLVDTPGIFTQVPDRLTSKLNEKARESLAGIDALVYVVDPTRHVGDEEEIVHRMVSASNVPKVLVINKSDRKGEFREEYLAWEDEFDRVIEISALKGHNVRAVTDAVFELLPEGDPLYPEGELTNTDAMFRMAELIREKVFLATGQEVPYTTTVEVEEIDRRENGVLYVKAAILTAAPRYKRMLIGAGGQRIKAIGRAVRKEIETVSGDRAYIDLEVRVEPRWQERFE